MKITSIISQASVKVFVNDVLHIHYLRDKYLGLQSWQYGTEQMFYIEIILIDGIVLCDYDRHDMWVNILAELAKTR